MSNLSIQTLTIPAADLGAENPLVPLEFKQPGKALKFPPDLPREMVENIAYGNLSSAYPYPFQDDFNRQLKPQDFPVAILENEFLRATFLLEFGGRLWSLIYKPIGRELVETNPVFQLANLALRKAWFSGGVEWNIGTLGHSPFTCSPLFTCRVIGDQGNPILRFYEWERFRNTPFQIDASLPDGSSLLFIRTRIINPNDHPVPIYWWSNIAVPETADTRVVVPARYAYCLGCRPNHLKKIPVPKNDGVDFTYSVQVDEAVDFFFELEDNSFPWITALDGNGQGFVQLSTPEMIGRKLWVWGSGRAGRNWQHWLSPSGKGYIEIQSGLTRTQLEHKKLRSGKSISWLEAYGFLEADPSLVHGEDWGAVYQHVNLQVQKLISPEVLLHEHQTSDGLFDLPPAEYFQNGSGWGALERKRREISTGMQQPQCGFEFGDESLTQEQEPWLALLETGSFPPMDVEIPINSYVSSDLWGSLIEQTLDDQDVENWYAWYQVGITRYHAGNLTGAEAAWTRSFTLTWSPWAARNLAILAWRDGRLERAVNLFIEACNSTQGTLPLAIECGICLIQAERYEQWLRIAQSLPRSVQSNGRMRLLCAQAALAIGDLLSVEKFFAEGAIVADLREGENSISDLWIEYQVQKMCQDEALPENHPKIIEFRENPPVPIEFDYRIRK